MNSRDGDISVPHPLRSDRPKIRLLALEKIEKHDLRIATLEPCMERRFVAKEFLIVLKPR